MLGPDMDLRGDDIYTTLSKGWRILTENFKEMMIFEAIPLTITIVFLLLYIFSFEMFSSLDGAEAFKGLVILMMVLFPGMIMLTIIQLLFSGGFVGMAKEAYETGVTQAKTGFSVIKKYPLMIVATGFIVQVLISFGLCLCIIPGILFCYWWLFALPAVVIEGKGVSEALDTSKNFATNNSTFLFTVAIFIVISVGAIISMLISVGLTFPYGGVTEPPSIYNVPYLVRTIISSFLSALLGIYFILCVSVHYMRGRTTEVTWDGRIPAPPVPMNWSRLPDEKEWDYEERS